MSTLPPHAMTGRTLAGRYSLVRLIGRGGMGLVYLARDLGSGQDVVIKLLAPHWASDPEALDRFAREGIRLASLCHPNIVQFYGYGEDRGEQFIAMEYVHGESLRHFLRRQDPLPLRVFAPIAAQVLTAASYAHEQRLMLRDIKPSNIMLTEHDGRANFVKLLDFGLAKFAEGHEVEITKSYAVGTAGYLAPELIRGERGDLRVDVYALGVLFFRMLTGESPIVGDNDGALLYNHVHSEPRAMSSWLPQPHDIPDALVALITGCLAKDPHHRPASAAEIHRHLLACVSPELFMLPPASSESRYGIELFGYHQQAELPASPSAYQSGDTWKRAQFGQSRRRPTVLMGPPPPPTGSGEYDFLQDRVPPGSDEGAPTRLGSLSFHPPAGQAGPPAPAQWLVPAAATVPAAPDEIEVEFDADGDVEPTMLVRSRRRSLLPLGTAVGVLSVIAVGLIGFVVWSQPRNVSSTGTEAPISEDALVVIEVPAQGWVHVDERPAVRGTFQARLPEGPHRVRVEADGFEPWSLEFQVTAGTPVSLKPSLREAPIANISATPPAVVVAPLPVPSAAPSDRPPTRRSDSKRRTARSSSPASKKSAEQKDSPSSESPKRDIFAPQKEQDPGIFLPVGKP